MILLAKFPWASPRLSGCSIFGRYYLRVTGGAATGDIEYLKANNIYNLAGNYFEITQENYSIDTLVSIRGGNLNCSGNYAPAAERYCHNSYSEYVSFRMSFYV